jgi:hypothetical protein
VANVDNFSRFVPIFNNISVKSRHKVAHVFYRTIMSVEIPQFSSVWSWMKVQTLFLSDTAEVNFTSTDTQAQCDLKFSEQNLFILWLRHNKLNYGAPFISLLLKFSFLSQLLSIPAQFYLCITLSRIYVSIILLIWERNLCIIHDLNCEN